MTQQLSAVGLLLVAILAAGDAAAQGNDNKFSENKDLISMIRNSIF
jgi:hypothetical protein